MMQVVKLKGIISEISSVYRREILFVISAGLDRKIGGNYPCTGENIVCECKQT
jgi:hypothetical protein